VAADDGPRLESIREASACVVPIAKRHVVLPVARILDHGGNEEVAHGRVRHRAGRKNLPVRLRPRSGVTALVLARPWQTKKKYGPGVERDAVRLFDGLIPRSLLCVDRAREEVQLQQFVRPEVVRNPPGAVVLVVEREVCACRRSSKLLELGDITRSDALRVCVSDVRITVMDAARTL
jgi:hypothetical protein